MNNDYRNTKYCPCLSEVKTKKEIVKKAVLEAYPKAKDMHTYISKKDKPFKLKFVEAYNGKCAYCGVSTQIVPIDFLEVDHYIYRKAACFKSKKEAGYMDNLVLACYDCNREKRDYLIPKDSLETLHPDGSEITKCFIRDDDYYIKINPKIEGDNSVKSFYEKLKLGSPKHRIDYLLLNMMGLSEKYLDKPEIYSKLAEAITLLQAKRNLMIL